MMIDGLAESLNSGFAGGIISREVSFGDLTLIVKPDHLVDIARDLRDNPDFRFDLLLDIAAVDNVKRWPEGVDDDEYDEDARFEVVYIFNSTAHNHRIRLKVQLPEDDPVLPTLTGVYGSADWGEREAFDMMGIRFTGHSNLKRILTHYKFKGYALRKDYPVDKEQWLDEPEPLVDEIIARLDARGIEVRFEEL